jgi:hypothetical protein
MSRIPHIYQSMIATPSKDAINYVLPHSLPQDFYNGIATTPPKYLVGNSLPSALYFDGVLEETLVRNFILVALI